MKPYACSYSDITNPLDQRSSQKPQAYGVFPRSEFYCEEQQLLKYYVQCCIRVFWSADVMGCICEECVGGAQFEHDSVIWTC